MSHGASPLGEIPQVVSFLNLQREPDDTSTLANDVQQTFNGTDMHRLVRPAVGVAREEVRTKPKATFIPVLSGKTAPGDKGPRDDNLPESPGYELQLDEEVLESAHTALIREVRSGNDFRVQEILQVTPAIRKDLLQRKNADGNTVLHLAANVRSSEKGALVLSYLQYSKAELEAKNMLGETALLLAVRQALGDGARPEALNLVSCLLKGRADPNTSELLNKETPLMEAACYGSKAVTQLLLDFQADVAQTTGSGSTALDFATSEGHSSLAKLLEAAQARKARQKCKTPLWEAPFATTMGFDTWSSGPPGPAPPEMQPELRKAAPKPTESERPGFIPSIFASGQQIRSRIFMASGDEFTEFTNAYRAQQPPSAKPPSSTKAPPRPEAKSVSSEHFGTLGLQPGATVEDVRAAYRKLALQYHPDKNQGSQEASEKFRQVKRAYEFLLSGSFSIAFFGNSLVAIAAGEVGQFTADLIPLTPLVGSIHYGGYTGPFVAANCFLVLCLGLMISTWSENFGQTAK
ncbi:dnaJ, partial [Symbiodinium sp. CCMP2456]